MVSVQKEVKRNISHEQRNIHQENITTLNGGVPNNRVQKYMKQITKLKRETEKFTITVRDFNTPPSLIGRTTILKKKKEKYKYKIFK